ncbi:helix-turn-helix domain-containing protein [Haloglomus salinum]|jgi:predicted DNA binding protein|uniref:helix-turn-helix domain-containing protein n=1 Tax=Haloglomus salinum TaxID=2962673 RepID=UPI0020C97858|nr:helix-turn-helix domain-containing protein [Haloglomus salinum]
MRYVDFLLIPRGRYLHPAVAAVADDPDVHREAIHHFNVLEDGSAVVLLEFSGDADRLEELVGDDPDIISYDLSVSETGIFSYSRITADEELQQLYSVPQRRELVLDTPMRYTDRGALEVRAIGNQRAIREAIKDVPDGLGLKFLSTGEYDPEQSESGDQLTERQREILRTAVEMGYYEEPRQTNYQELADELDLSSGTVGEHLRKIESTVLKRLVP